MGRIFNPLIKKYLDYYPSSGGTGDIWVEKAGDTMTGGLTITNTSTSTPALSVNQNAVLDAGTYAIRIYSNEAQTAEELVNIHQDNASSSKHLLEMTNDGSGHIFRGVQAGVLGAGARAFEARSAVAQTQSTAAMMFFALDHASSTSPVAYLLNAGTGNTVFIDHNNSGRSINIDQDTTSANDAVGLWVNTSNAGAGGAYAAIFESGRVGIGKTAPALALHVVGDFQVDDADTSTKGYRFRTSGSNLDVEAAGADIFISAWSGAGFTGTQRNKLRFESGAEITKAINEWQFTDGPFGSTQHKIDGAGGIIINETGGDFDTRIEGDTDANLVFVDAGQDAVGIGTASPNAVAKLQVDSTTKGFLPPRMTTTQRDAISTPPAGLMIYNTTTNKLNVYTTAWEAITSA